MTYRIRGNAAAIAPLLRPCNSRAPAVIFRTRGALLLSCTQASVAEFRRQALAPDEQQAPPALLASRLLLSESDACGADRALTAVVAPA